ncbi:MAG TPA: methyltransferase [Clostridiales bacterium]|nr:methyltransferase [Clostridiales bacterium]
MKRNIKQWFADQMSATVKKPLPILSFPAVQLMGISVRQLVSDSSLQARAMKLVAETVDTAASVSFMDLSVEAECFGSNVKYSDDEVPTVVGGIVYSEEDALALKIPEAGAGRTKLYLEAVAEALKVIEDRPVFAGSIGPFSLAGRLMEVSEALINCYDEPGMVHITMEKATRFITEYILEYKKLGADGVVIAEPLTGLLSPDLAAKFSAPYVKMIVDAVQDDNFAVIYHNCGNNTLLMTEEILSCGAMAYHFGNAISMAEMLEKIPAGIPVMGNVNPAGVIKDGTLEDVRKATLDLLETCSKYPNFIISSGCDIPPMSPWENIHAFFDTVKEYYER